MKHQRRDRKMPGIDVAFVNRLVAQAILRVGAGGFDAVLLGEEALQRADGDRRIGLLKAIAKTVIQTGVYPVLFLTVAWKGWKADKIAHHP